MKDARPYNAVVPLSIGLGALILTCATFLIPSPAETINPVAAHWRGAAATMAALLLIGSACVFAGGLKSFKAGRAAYLLVAGGILTLSILFIQVAIWGIFDMWESAWASSGSGILPLGFAFILTHLGARKFAAMLNVKSMFNSVWFVTAVSVSAGVAMGFFADYYVKYNIPGTAMYIGVCAWGAAYASVITIAMHKVSNAMGAAYRNAMRWLTIGFGVLSLTVWHESITTLWFNNGSTFTDYGYYLLPWVATGVMMLYASYQFRKMTAFARSGELPTAEPTDQDYIDSIVTVAGLASRPEDVDGILDGLREVTSRMQPGQPLNSEQHEQLLHTYGQLEEYLRHHDPLRMVTQDELYSRVTPGFRTLLKRRPSGVS